MAKNAGGNSRIPVPRAVRPTFLPKTKSLQGTSKSISLGQQQSTIHGECFQFITYEDGAILTQGKVRTPEGKLLDTTYTKSSVWSGFHNDDHLSYFGEEKFGLLSSLVENNQLGKIEDTGDSNNSCPSVDAPVAGCYAEASSTSSMSTGASAPRSLTLNKQNSFEHDESLGILTPDQMTDFTVALECSRTPSSENLASSSGGSKLQTLTRSSTASTSNPRTEAVTASAAAAAAVVGDTAVTAVTATTATTAATAVEAAAVAATAVAVAAERSPSPEELPLDPKPSEVPPASFVTSVTSITSLEAGYQGDGENSRPASRGPELPSVLHQSSSIIVQPCRQDPMTDSDFFTESDADAHEEIGRGDRRAQVIDGTLFCAPGGRRCPSFMGEEMDSSGIYSDFDKRLDDGPLGEANFSDAHTPDTADTEVSLRSQPSPVVRPEAAEAVSDCIQVSSATKSLGDSIEPHDSLTPVEHCGSNVLAKIDDAPQSPSLAKSDSVALKKYKMPKRNVISKIKAMIESGKDEAEKEARSPQRPTRRNGRWDAVMSKIEAGKNDQRPRSRKEVKSRVFQGLSNSASNNTSSNRRLLGDANNNAARANKDKRRLRGRQELRSPTQETARSSVRSSTSDLSSAYGKDIPKRLASNVANQTRRQANGLNNQQTRINTYDAKKNCLDSQTTNLGKRASTVTVRRTQSSVSPRQQNTPLPKDRRQKESSVIENNTVPLVEKRDQAAQTLAPYDAVHCERTKDIAIQALAITVQYLSNQTDYERMKTEWMSAKTEVEELRAKYCKLEEALYSQKEEHEESLNRFHKELESQHAERIKQLEAAMREERRELARIQESLEKDHRSALAQLQADHANELARREAELDRRSFVHDHGATLLAEAESLRSVLELKKEEVASLRADNDSLRRQLDDKEVLEQRVVSLEARCEDLKAQLQGKDSYERQISHQNEVLLESFHQVTKHNKRIAQQNEELIWRLKHKSKMVNALANQLATPTSNMLSRSVGSEPSDISQQQNWLLPSSEQQQQCSSMVKFVVEKGDSVSWTLDIDESGECEALSTHRNPSTSSTVPQQGSLRLSNSRRRNFEPIRNRSTSFSETSSHEENGTWNIPMFSSTPRRNGCRPSSGESTTSLVVETVDEETNSGPRPQEAGGEAMISEETSAFSSEDESSAGSDIPRLPLMDLS